MPWHSTCRRFSPSLAISKVEAQTIDYSREHRSGVGMVSEVDILSLQRADPHESLPSARAVLRPAPGKYDSPGFPNEGKTLLREGARSVQLAVLCSKRASASRANTRCRRRRIRQRYEPLPLSALPVHLPLGLPTRNSGMATSPPFPSAPSI